MKVKYNEQDMAKLLVEVETEFKEYLSKAEQSQKAESSVKEEKVSLETAEGFDYDEEDISEMNKMYASMSKSEKEAHYSAIKKTLFNETKEESKETSSKEEATDLKKSEKDEEKELLKSEAESAKSDLANSKKENEELKKNIETLTTIVSKIVKKAPARKAVTQIGNIQVMKKSEDDESVEEKKEVDFSKLSKAEVNKILTSKIRSGEITKSEDKENINKFCYGQIQIDKIKHLL